MRFEFCSIFFSLFCFYLTYYYFFPLFRILRIPQEIDLNLSQNRNNNNGINNNSNNRNDSYYNTKSNNIIEMTRTNNNTYQNNTGLTNRMKNNDGILRPKSTSTEKDVDPLNNPYADWPENSENGDGENGNGDENDVRKGSSINVSIDG